MLLRFPVTGLMLSMGIFFFVAFVLKPQRMPCKISPNAAAAQRRGRLRATSSGSRLRVAVSRPHK